MSESTPQPTPQDRLDRFRKSIDNLDAALVHLLAERFTLTLAVGRLKAEVGLPPADKSREAYQIERLRRLSDESGLDPAIAEEFLGLIIKHVIRSHEQLQGAGVADPEKGTAQA